MAREHALRREYRGMFVLALAEEFFVFRIRCFELGEPTGVRGSMVSAMLLNDPIRRKELLDDSVPPLQMPAGMNYVDFVRSQPLVVSPADAEEWDKKLPDDALTRLRGHMKRMRETVRIVVA
jgi:hypothetical protein